MISVQGLLLRLGMPMVAEGSGLHRMGDAGRMLLRKIRRSICCIRLLAHAKKLRFRRSELRVGKRPFLMKL